MMRGVRRTARGRAHRAVQRETALAREAVRPRAKEQEPTDRVPRLAACVQVPAAGRRLAAHGLRLLLRLSWSSAAGLKGCVRANLRCARARLTPTRKIAA